MEAEPKAAAGAAPGAAASAKDSSFQEEHYLVMQATVRHKKIKKTARTALYSAATILPMAVLSLPLLVWFHDPWSLLIVATLWVVGIVEYRGHKRLQQDDPAACRMLGFNQLALLAVLVTYFLTRMILPPSEDMKRYLASSGAGSAEIAHMLAALNYIMYTVLIVVVVAFQGGLALYYFSRRKFIEAYIHDTPEWIRRMITETGA
jgi:membrane protein insertase Oxa1/YidC/SpoIIIJ